VYGDPVCEGTDVTSARERQTVDQMRAEVRFRRFHGLDDLSLLPYVEKAIRERTGRFADLLLRGTDLAPFVELGCETGANGLGLVNRLGLRGISIDLSPDALFAMDRYRERLGFTDLPLRVCADFHDLPLRTGALAFALAWGTLHHVPDPRVPLAEVRRVLGRGGLFYFDGEPVRRLLSLGLATTRSIQGMNPIARLLLRARILPWFFSIDGREAIQEGALEMKFSAWEWKKFLPETFERVQFRWAPYLTADVRSVGAPTWAVLRALLGAERAAKVASAFFGGVVSGEAWKTPPLAARLLRADAGEARIALHKPQGNDRLVLRVPGAVAAPIVRIGTDVLPATGGEEPGVFAYGLPLHEAGAGVTEVVIAGTAGEGVAEIGTDGPAGRIAFPIDDPTAGARDADPESLLACPSCRIAPAHPFVEFDRPPLARVDSGYRCNACGTVYPIDRGVAFLLRPELSAKLGVR
jgi:SAM-dependent methyltransferase/uncharacterized protein YbaR (Trm112 family)